MGPVRLGGRAYYRCPACHTGHTPIDHALGLTAATLTPATEQLVTLAGTVDSFADAAEKLLPRMAGLRLAESTVERTTEAAGERLDQFWATGATLGVATAWQWNGDAQGRTVAYVSIDATGVGIQGEGGVKADGRMAWVGKVFNPRVEAAHASTAKARYQAGLMSLDELGARLRHQAAQVGMDQAQQWVALTDGGNGLEDFMAVHFPQATRVLDFYHAAEHLSDLAKAYCGPDATSAAELAGQWSHQLKHEGGEAVLARLAGLDLTGRSPAAREEHRLVSGYLRKNLSRTDYPAYRAAGWQIGSGHIEAACKTVINQRLKQSGMRWSEAGVDAICQLRALYEGERSQWDAFWAEPIHG